MSFSLQQHQLCVLFKCNFDSKIAVFAVLTRSATLTELVKTNNLNWSATFIWISSVASSFASICDCFTANAVQAGCTICSSSCWPSAWRLFRCYLLVLSADCESASQRGISQWNLLHSSSIYCWQHSLGLQKLSIFQTK